MKQELTAEIRHALQFVKVSLGTGNVTSSGYLSDVSCALLLTELNRSGLFIAAIRPIHEGGT